MKIHLYILMSFLLLMLTGCNFSSTQENASQGNTEKTIVSEKEAVESNQNDIIEDDTEVDLEIVPDNANDMLEFLDSYTEELYNEYINDVIHDETGEIVKVAKITQTETESGKNYKVYKLSNNLNQRDPFYRCELYDNDNILMRDLIIQGYPWISYVNLSNDSIIEMWLNAGTGTRLTWYYSISDNIFSDTFWSPDLAEKDKLVVFEVIDDMPCIVVQNIFDKEKLYKSVPIPDVSTYYLPVIKAEFIDDNTLEVIYSVNEVENEIEKTIIIYLNE